MFSFEKNKKKEEAFDNEKLNRINTFFEQNGITGDPNILSVLKLYFLRRITQEKQINDESLAKEIKFLYSQLSKEENEIGNKENPLPTMGIEIELQDSTFPPEYKILFPKIGILCEPENSKLFEINPRPSFGPKIQNEIMHNVRELGLAHRNMTNPISLHINFGIPANINYRDIEYYKDNIYLVNNLLVFAYSSAARISEVEIKDSFLYKKPAKADIKNTDNQDTDKEFDQFARIKTPKRIELRANEFGDNSTFRLLVESQRIMAMFFSHLKVLKKINTSPSDEKLSLLWDEFEKEVSDFIYIEQNIHPRTVENERKKTAKIMNARPEIKIKCRSIITKYSQKIAEIIKNKQN